MSRVSKTGWCLSHRWQDECFPRRWWFPRHRVMGTEILRQIILASLPWWGSSKRIFPLGGCRQGRYREDGGVYGGWTPQGNDRPGVCHGGHSQGKNQYLPRYFRPKRILNIDGNQAFEAVATGRARGKFLVNVQNSSD